MKTQNRIFNNEARGSMLVELLLSVALAVLIIPFIFRYQHDAARRAENIAIVNQMETVQAALERYIIDNRVELLKTVGKNITRVEITDLINYGVPESIVDKFGADYQLRVLKTNDINNQSTLQGVVVLSSRDITPVRTREIVGIGGTSMGFVDGNHAYGSFGAWHTDLIDLGIAGDGGVIQTTPVQRDNALYLWRVPSDNDSDATMMTSLNLGGHDITGAKYFDIATARFDEVINSSIIAAGDIIFQNRTTIDKTFIANSAAVAGTLSADSRNMEITGALKLADVGKFSNFTTNDLWVTNLNLSGLTVSGDEYGAVMININRSLDMNAGRIDAMFATVGFTGSITPRLVVRERIEDSTNPEYFWDTEYRVANFMDLTSRELNRMATLIVAREKGGNTAAGKAFAAVAANKNATVADFMNVITDIQNKVRAKYRLLNLE